LFLHAFDRHRAYLFTLFLKCNLFFVGGGWSHLSSGWHN
jgi:hypothetical protein